MLHNGRHTMCAYLDHQQITGSDGRNRLLTSLREKAYGMENSDPKILETIPDPFDGAQFVDRLIDEKDIPLVMFERHWCSFCQSARQLFHSINAPYLSIDLDDDRLRSGGQAAEIRAALTQRTGSTTVPQIFVAGRFLGGATETIAAYRSGKLQTLLAEHGIETSEIEAETEAFKSPRPFPF